MLRASWRIRKLALPQGMLPRRSEMKAFTTSRPSFAQPLEKADWKDEASIRNSDQRSEQDFYPEAGPSNYFTSSRSSAFFPSPETPTSPFSAETLSQLFATATSSGTSQDAIRLQRVWHYINLPKGERTHYASSACWRAWQRISPVTRRSLSRQVHQQVLRAVVPSAYCMRPYLEVVRRQANSERKEELGRDTWIRKSKADTARELKQKDKERQRVLGEAIAASSATAAGGSGAAGMSAGGEVTGATFSHLPDVGKRLRGMLDELDTIAGLYPTTHAPGSSNWDYRYALLYLSRVGDSYAAERIADTMRHRGATFGSRHIDARLVALVRHLERTRFKRAPVSVMAREVDGVVKTLWKILGDLNTHQPEQELRQVTVTMLVQAINLARRILRRTEASEAASSPESATESGRADRHLPLGVAAARAASASTSPTSSSASDKALELDYLLQDVLMKGYGIDLAHPTFSPVPAASPRSQSRSSAPAGDVRKVKMTGVVLYALVDHFGRRGELWKMLEVLHVYGEQVARGDVDAVLRAAGSTYQSDMAGTVDMAGGYEQEAPTLSAMMQKEAEGRRGMTIFGRTRAGPDESTNADTTEPTVQQVVNGIEEPSSSSKISSPSIIPPYPGARYKLPAQGTFADFYPSSSSLPDSAATSRSHVAVADTIETEIDAHTNGTGAVDAYLHAYETSTQRTDVYMNALQHALRTDDWALTLHVLSTAVTASKEERDLWLEARKASLESQAAAAVAVDDTTGPPSALPSFPPPRISLYPEWFLRTHIRMTRHRAGARHMAKLQDLLLRALQDGRAEARALADMEGWDWASLTKADLRALERNGVLGQREAEALLGGWEVMRKIEKDEVDVREAQTSAYAEEHAQADQAEGAEIPREDKTAIDELGVRAMGKQGVNLLSPVGAYIGQDAAQAPLALGSAGDTVNEAGEAQGEETLSATSASASAQDQSQTQTPGIVAAPAPSKHLLNTLHTLQSLKGIMSYSLHKSHLRKNVRLRSNLRMEANKVMREQKAREEERERAQKKGRARAGGRQRKEETGEEVLLSRAHDQTGGVAMA